MYGACILAQYETVERGMCEREFGEFKNCVQSKVGTRSQKKREKERMHLEMKGKADQTMPSCVARSSVASGEDYHVPLEHIALIQVASSRIL